MMRRHSVRLALTVAVLVAAPGPASAAERRYTVTNFDKVRVDGGYAVTVVTGKSPSVRAEGAPAGLDQLDVKVEGTTLIVRRSANGWGGYPGQNPGPVRLMVTTSALKAAWVNGAGQLDLDQVRGLSFDLSVQGAGRATIGRVDLDKLSVALAGAASARVAGRAGRVQALVRGSSILDVDTLTSRGLELTADGAAVVRARVDGPATITAVGPVSVVLSGKAACTVRAQGSASIAGC